VTLTASMQDPTGRYLAAGASVDFIDCLTNKVLAKDVPMTPVPGSEYTGTANTVVTLSSGQYGSESYVIRVVATGNYTNKYQPDADKTATVVVSKPAATNEITGGGKVAGAAKAGTYAVSSAAVPACYSVGVRFNKSATNLQGQVLLTIPQADGSVVYVKSNSLSSLAVTRANAGDSAILYAKASVYRVAGEATTSLDGNVTIRVDGVEGAPGAMGFTVLSSKDSTLFYSNRWMLDGKTWKTVPEAVTGTVQIN
jgi:hypothetical protein